MRGFMLTLMEWSYRQAFLRFLQLPSGLAIQMFLVHHDSLYGYFINDQKSFQNQIQLLRSICQPLLCIFKSTDDIRQSSYILLRRPEDGSITNLPLWNTHSLLSSSLTAWPGVVSHYSELIPCQSKSHQPVCNTTSQQLTQAQQLMMTTFVLLGFKQYETLYQVSYSLDYIVKIKMYIIHLTE